MANVQLGEIAMREYSKVWYYPFGNSPATPFALTSNPFAFLVAWIDSEMRIIKKETPHRNRLKKAKYFCELAEAFNSSAVSSKMPAKATPLYYAHLNLVKCYLLVNGLELEKQFEHHGLSLPHDYETKLKIGGNPKEGISIFKEFAQQTGVDFGSIAGTDVSLIQLLTELPEIHELGFALKVFEGKRKMLPVKVEIRTNEKHTKLFYDIIYEKKNEKFMGVERLDKNHLKGKIKEIPDSDSNILRYRSEKRISFDRKKEISWENSYKKLCKDINALGVTSILTRDGYRFYINLSPARLNRYCSTLAFMFYLGAVARYRPSLNESVLNGEYQALVNEATETIPNQFYFHLVSLITNRVCAMPMAKI